MEIFVIMVIALCNLAYSIYKRNSPIYMFLSVISFGRVMLQRQHPRNSIILYIAYQIYMQRHRGLYLVRYFNLIVLLFGIRGNAGI